MIIYYDMTLPYDPDKVHDEEEALGLLDKIKKGNQVLQRKLREKGEK